MLPPAYLKLTTFVAVFFVTAYIFVARTPSTDKQSIGQSSECRQHKNMMGFCAAEQCVSPFKTYNWIAMMNYAPKYGLANCAIPKSLSTVTMAIFCYLYDSDAFVAKNRTLSKEKWMIRFCKVKNEGYQPDPELLHASNWTHIAVVRHPVDRFLSGFVDKCVK
uniref:Carbohydrate sulfotransferase n=1 Tax=Plectus sambesii TaxID=2011161 RepID=A0A914W4N0_9BILA